MSKGLEALENILNQELIKQNKYRKTIRDIASVGQVITIQKEFEDYEETKRDLKQVMNDYQDLGNSCYKKLKALEIIKNKQVNMFVFLDIPTVNTKEDYNYYVDDKLTQEEYDLLKEVLL